MLRHFTAACLAALLALNVVAPRTSAKPPDLPDDDPIIVAVPEPGAAQSEAFPYPLVDICCEAKPEPIATMPTIESTCPYIAAQADRRALTGADLKGMPSLMDNLRALEKAAGEIDIARKLGAAGKMTEAIEHLDKARKLCPGSSYAKRGDEVMNELDEVMTRKSAAVEPGETACPASYCAPLTRIHNVGACCMAQVATYCAKVQATAMKHGGCCGSKANDSAAHLITMQFDKTPLAQIIAEISESEGVAVILDPVALRMRGLSAQVPITLHVENVPLRAALDLMCRPLGLEARVCGEAIRISMQGAGIRLPCPLGDRVILEAIRINVKEASTSSLMFGLGVNSDSGLTGSIVLNERNFDCKRGCTSGEQACESQSACPKCEKMHQEVMKKAAGVKEQVDGLMKACYFAVREGRNAKAADLARQAHALDPKRVEADPLVYKLHMTAEKGQCEECEPAAGSTPTCPHCPTAPAEDNVSLRPTLPAIDPEVVVALDRVLTVRTVGKDGLERIGVDFNVVSKENATKGEDAKASCCPCWEGVQYVGVSCLPLFFGLPPKDSDKGFIMLGLGTNGITGYSISKYAGMKILVHYRGGLPIVWVAPDPAATESH
jgi:hypothetical protein